MPKIHPITFIVFGMFIISLGFNVLQARQIKELEIKKATIIIKPNIRLYEPPDEIIIIQRGRKGFDYN